MIVLIVKIIKLTHNKYNAILALTKIASNVFVNKKFFKKYVNPQESIVIFIIFLDLY